MDEQLRSVYDELRRLARGYLARERVGHTLQATALVHEAYLRLAAQRGTPANPRQLVGLAAQMMRRVLVNHGLAQKADKRGAGALHLTLSHAEHLAQPEGELDVLALDRALTRLAELDPRQAQVVELRYFGGLSIDETASAMALSLATVKREWATARLWLKRELSEQA